MQKIFRTIGMVAPLKTTVLVTGESGTGKELIAKALHYQSPRADKALVTLNCAAIPENLLESELFGHVKGAFTGALRDRRGRFQEAHGGTLLLDEIGDISPTVQVKLLRVIEQRAVERVGDSQPIHVDVRLLCATHRDLKELVAAGRFRADLYFRLAVFPLRVPPLRDHLEDLPLLCARFLARVAPGAPGPSPEALATLGAYGWPGNVRELQNALEYAALRAAGAPIAPEHLPEDVRGGAGPERAGGGAAALRRALEAHGWNREQAARALGVSRVTLWKRMKRAGVSPPPGAAPAAGGARR
jgi:transcriptional regulator with GAF, ATPase, and Fis domain